MCFHWGAGNVVQRTNEEDCIPISAVKVQGSLRKRGVKEVCLPGEHPSGAQYANSLCL